MGKIYQGILGEVSGKVGNTVSSSWKDINTIRIYQPNVYNPQTEAQTIQRTKFSTVVELVRQVIPVINSAYNGELTKMSPFNKVTSINLKNAFTGNTTVIDQTKVSFCNHKGSSVSNVTLNGDIDQEMLITWNPNTSNANELAASLTFLLINCDTLEVATYYSAATRTTGSVSLTAPSTWVGSQTALHIVTVDYVRSGGLIPMTVIKFKAGADLASKVK